MRDSAQPAAGHWLGQEILLKGSIRATLVVVCLAQVIAVSLGQLKVVDGMFWVSIGLIEAGAFWVAYRQCFPRYRLFFNGVKLLVCCPQGRVHWEIVHPQGFCSPFFIGLRLSAFQALGVFVDQVSSADFAALSRWARGFGGKTPA